MKLRPRLLFSVPVLAFLLFASGLFAQLPPGVSESLDSLADQPANHTGFVFDRTMMQVARGLLQSGDVVSGRAAASISRISYDDYHYAQPVRYTPEAMAAIIATYHSAGWKHLVNAHDNSTDSGQHRSIATDLWLHFSGTDVDGVTVLARGVRNMSLVQVACDLRPLDLLKLSGHFGIPKIDPSTFGQSTVDSGAVMVPDKNNR
jgi:hypothetical protein